MPFLAQDAVIMAGVSQKTRVKILDMKIEMAKKSVVDYVEPKSFNWGVMDL